MDTRYKAELPVTYTDELIERAEAHSSTMANGVREDALPKRTLIITELFSDAFLAGGQDKFLSETQERIARVIAKSLDDAVRGHEEYWGFDSYHDVVWSIGEVSAEIAKTGVVKVGDTSINLWEQNMFAIRLEVPIGFAFNTPSVEWKAGAR